MSLIVEGSIEVPGDKSVSHRSLMLAAAATGRSRLSGVLPGADCISTAQILRDLGCDVPDLPTDGGEFEIVSQGLGSWSRPDGVLDCGNSGTTARLMMGLLAGRPFCATLAGDESLESRPMRRITDPLGQMGARFHEIGAPDRLPIEVCGGGLKEIRYRSPKASAQIKSAILLAGLSSGVAVEVWEPVRSRDHSERMLTSLGIQIEEGEAEGGWRVGMKTPPSHFPPLDLRVPGDISSAAFLLALGLIAEGGELSIRNVGVNPTRTGFLRAVQLMGGSINIENKRLVGGEAVAELIVRPARLTGSHIGGADIPSMIDELPILACLAARAEGQTRITDAAELRAKESDRIDAMVTNLRAIGVEVEELPDGLVITGTDRPLRGRVAARHDHRIAMAFGVLSALPDSEIEIDTPEVVDVSFPGFWSLLERLSSPTVSS